MWTRRYFWEPLALGPGYKPPSSLQVPLLFRMRVICCPRKCQGSPFPWDPSYRPGGSRIGVGQKEREEDKISEDD